MTARIKAYGLVMAALFALAFSGRAQGTAFSYQGHLSESGAAASGPYDLIFSLFDAASAGTQIGSSVTFNSLPINDGLFNVTLDFGANVFVGDSRWLEISVRRGGSGPFTKLDARMAVLPNPYAIYAATAGKLADNSVAADQLKTSGALPAAGQFLSYNGTSLVWSDPAIASGSLWSKSGADVYYSGGNVGIGGLAATSKLQITGSDALTLIGPGPYLTWFDTTTARSAAISSGGGTLYYRVPDADGKILTAGYVDSNGMVTRGRLSVEANGPYITWADTGSGRSAAISSANGTLYYRVPDPAGNVLTAGYVDSNGMVTRGRLSVEGNVTVTQNVGIGTTAPISKLHVETSVSQAAVYGNATGPDSFGVFGEAKAPSSVGVWGRNASGFAMYADGDVGQAREKGGFAKAMVYVNADGSIARCYNGMTGTAAGPCGFKVINHGPVIVYNHDGYIVDFGFKVTDRFISVTPRGSSVNVAATFFLKGDDGVETLTENQVFIDAFVTDVDYLQSKARTGFMIIIY